MSPTTATTSIATDTTSIITSTTDKTLITTTVGTSTSTSIVTTTTAVNAPRLPPVTTFSVQVVAPGQPGPLGHGNYEPNVNNAIHCNAANLTGPATFTLASSDALPIVNTDLTAFIASSNELSRATSGGAAAAALTHSSNHAPLSSVIAGGQVTCVAGSEDQIFVCGDLWNVGDKRSEGACGASTLTMILV